MKIKIQISKCKFDPTDIIFKIGFFATLMSHKLCTECRAVNIYDQRPFVNWVDYTNPNGPASNFLHEELGNSVYEWLEDILKTLYSRYKQTIGENNENKDSNT